MIHYNLDPTIFSTKAAPLARSGDSGFELLWLGDNKVLKNHVVILKLSTNSTYCNTN